MIDKNSIEFDYTFYELKKLLLEMQSETYFESYLEIIYQLNEYKEAKNNLIDITDEEMSKVVKK